jgi:hypothetical protein
MFSIIQFLLLFTGTMPKFLRKMEAKHTEAKQAKRVSRVRADLQRQ